MCGIGTKSFSNGDTFTGVSRAQRHRHTIVRHSSVECVKAAWAPEADILLLLCV
jgi:hypothetical protein